MPQMDGIETINQINALNLKKDTVVIALTANAIAGAKEMYLSNGFDDYLSKPIQITEMEQMLVKYIPYDKVYAANQTKGVDTSENKEPETTPEQNSSVQNELKYIDEAVGLKYCAYNKEMYSEFLKIYYDGFDVKLEQLKQLFEERNWNDYITSVHSLKSTTLNIGGVQLSEYAATLEQKGKEYLSSKKEEELTYLLEHHEELIKLYCDTIQEIESMIAK